MLEHLAPQPPDPLLALIGQFAADPRTTKIDLGVGVYRDENGLTPVLRAVKTAEARLLAAQTSKAYLGPSGDLLFIERLRDLVFGRDAQVERIIGLQTPGGTGALRAAADLLVRAGASTVWVGRPTWANHDPVFAAAGLKARDYVYFDPKTQKVDFEAMTAALSTADRGDIVLLQAACHNPTGADPSLPQWRDIADIVASRGLIPLVDVAYQGLGTGLEEDMAGARLVLAAAEEALVAVSCSKTFGLYRERTGAVFTLAPNSAARPAVESNMLAIARANYSMPPDHGAAVVGIILGDADLTRDWRQELSEIRGRIQAIRARMAAFGRRGDFDLGALAGQHGMFSLLPLSPDQIRALRDDDAIYMTGFGRINVAGLRGGDIDALMRRLLPRLEAV